MILAQHALEATLTPESVWDRWTAVASWPEWNPRLERAELDGAFRKGAWLDLRWPGRAPWKVVVVECEAGQHFTLERSLFGARIASRHRIEPGPLGVRLSQRVEVRGWTGWLVAWYAGPAWRAALPEILRGLARQAAEDTRK